MPGDKYNIALADFIIDLYSNPDDRTFDFKAITKEKPPAGSNLMISLRDRHDLEPIILGDMADFEENYGFIPDFASTAFPEPAMSGV